MHGHFYQPPRENPWLEMVELQDSAYPFHDWNDRITAECYAANSVARILEANGRIARLVNNYSRISFNFGPTLLSWLEGNSPDVYRRILEADRDSRERFSGHGSALAQVYNHVIMPLADRTDKVTQVVWGIRDFRKRFGREPEGMWLAETAVDLETLEVLAEYGIRFTVLAPHQAARVRPRGQEEWRDVTGAKIDPSMAYVQVLPSGRSIGLFFYDGPISRAVAFEHILANGETFANRLLAGFSDSRTWPQMIHIATDGESYGHHHPHGDMALAFALNQIESNPEVKLTNYAEFLERHPPQWEVQIHENTSWSCAHGIERWRSNCGCNSGRPRWTQNWREPLRKALDALRDALRPEFERHAGELLNDPWGVRNDYVEVILDRRSENVNRFLEKHARKTLSDSEQIKALKLLEIQRNALLMYTSCGWFFDELSGIETVQILMYAGRAIQLAQEVFGTALEPMFLERLAAAPSNLPGLHKTGKEVYEKYVWPARVEWKNMGAHVAVSSIFEPMQDVMRAFACEVATKDKRILEAGRFHLSVGHAIMRSDITREAFDFAYAALHLGDHNVNAGVKVFPGDETYQASVSELTEAFGRVDVPQILRLIDKYFGESTYSLASLFRDVQRQVLRQLMGAGLNDIMDAYHRIFEQNLPLMRFLRHLSVPLPLPMQSLAQVSFNSDLRWALQNEEPDLEQIRALAHDSEEWEAKLDAQGLGYSFTQMLERGARRWREKPAEFDLMTRLSKAVDLVNDLPFEPNLWFPQNVFFDVAADTFPAQIEAARLGDEAARSWIDAFLALGDKLQVDVEPLKKKQAELTNRPTVEALVRELIAERHVPTATYRLQLNRGFPFPAATDLVPYLAELGVSDAYISPVLQARPGSPHGYDICDHSQISSDLCGEEGMARFSAALRERGMGIVLDVVANHMAVNHPGNTWWNDVLENGASSRFAHYFDIDWYPVNPDLTHKVLLPVLGEQYGATLESGKLRLVYENGSFVVTYFESRFPLAPRTYTDVLNSRLELLTKRLGEDHEHVLEYRSIITALGYLPPQTRLSTERQSERYREVTIIKRRLANLVSASPDVQTTVDSAVEQFNGKLGFPDSFNPFDHLLNQQSYRLAFWRVAMDEINYRRFFDVNELAAVRIEFPDVFTATHAVARRLLAEGKVRALRVDHPDGFYTPAKYFRDLQEDFAVDAVRAKIGAGYREARLRREVADALASAGAGRFGPLYIVAEKILGENEPLPANWAVDGTTGYDFLNALNGVFVASEKAAEIDRIYSGSTGQSAVFAPVVRACKQIIMRVAMASEINTLSHQLDRLTERNRRYRDFTLSSLRAGLREFIACLSIYRTYTTPDGKVSDRDRRFVETATEEAKQLNPRTAEAVFDFIRDIVLLRNLDQFPAQERNSIIDWVMRFQQVTGPIMAKGIEDTAFYVYNRLLSLNEVGGYPDRFGTSVEEFHRQNLDRAARWPNTMLATATHDTKRSEDVRARINVLSELPQEWGQAVNEWLHLLKGALGLADGQPAPSANDQYKFFQNLLGIWPSRSPNQDEINVLQQRMLAYMEKATKEAKQHTSWINPDLEYDEAARKFVISAFAGSVEDNRFLSAVNRFAQRIAVFGRFNSMSQVVIKLTSPGVPDIYQGNELWDYSLVDPDNRRPVDYAVRRALLEKLRPALDGKAKDLVSLASELLAKATDGRIKLYLTARLLRYRAHQRSVFREGEYAPLQLAGAHAYGVCAYRWCLGQKTIIVAGCIRPATVTGGREVPPVGPDIWSDTFLQIPVSPTDATWRNVLTGEQLNSQTCGEAIGLWVKNVFNVLPVAVLECL
jgi:(1->4)-alpha-D-glucan 1-alpha-D-glucosylmutase